MNWKTYTLGVGTMAALFAAAQPSRMPAGVQPEQPREAAGVAAAASEIEEQAARLQARLQHEALYREPARNLFRFADRRAAAAASPERTAVEAAPPATPPPPPFPVRLAGIAVDQENGAAVHTAILSTPNGVVLARAGDEVLGQFRVSRIDDDAVELVSTSGDAVRLSLRP